MDISSAVGCRAFSAGRAEADDERGPYSDLITRLRRVESRPLRASPSLPLHPRCPRPDAPTSLLIDTGERVSLFYALRQLMRQSGL